MGHRFDFVARAFDYTPATPDDPAPLDDAGRRGGGADRFLDLIEARLKPIVHERVSLDRRRESLWGHSYGGLFTLHAAFTRPDAFAHFIAASPSLWWNYGSILQEIDPFLNRRLPPDFRLGIVVGESEKPHRQSSPPSAGARNENENGRKTPMRASVPPDAARMLTERLRGAGVPVDFEVLDGLGHGAMLGASLRYVLLEDAHRSQASSVSQRPRRAVDARTVAEPAGPDAAGGRPIRTNSPMMRARTADDRGSCSAASSLRWSRCSR